MKSQFLSFFCSYLALFIPLFANDHYTSTPIYSQIKDIYHPTLKELKRIQHYLASDQRYGLDKLGFYKANIQNFKIIGNSKKRQPRSGVIAVGCKKTIKENCLILYSSFNKNYVGGLKRLISFVKRSDFKGHILYRVGGWPNIKGGSLNLAHVPYAFKPSFFKEAERLGYKRVLWLDAAILPIVSLNSIFKTIQEKGYFVMGNSHMIGQYMNEAAAQAFGIHLQDTYQIPSCSAGLLGVDLTNARARQVIERWYALAHHASAFYSERPEQNALSIILHQSGITDFESIHRLAHGKNSINADSLFLLERSYVKKKAKHL